jgi:hypothetical protein
MILIITRSMANAEPMFSGEMEHFELQVESRLWCAYQVPSWSGSLVEQRFNSEELK